ncbi:thyrotropin-releasing hormone receptor-like [Mizuhopecten yessoensis]|uniref:Adrenocorticotropic hormone receptor n=1 Tax=Mizuhopecten yessoensis TaxID=6573 RepID=A0A210PP32_MIZYE|nr:thyrotropin-releasing hormone receptor-like [Mizuhopecten yessoensis]OWF38228.1 Adrenocorticotropic hormone receptor [Mizuhopecten yessoensis]
MSSTIIPKMLIASSTDLYALRVDNSTPYTNGSAKTHDTGNCLTSYCVPITIAISCIALIGIITNLIVVFVIVKDSRLRRPTFIAIVALSLSDFTFLLFRYIRYVVMGYFRDLISAHVMKTIKFVCDLVGLTAGGSSIMHVLLLSVLRYYIVVHPLKSHIAITNKRIILVSLCVWVFSALNGWFYLYAVIINRENDLQMSKVTNITITLVMSILPLATILFFHVLKARTLKDSLAACKLNATKQMSQIVTFVIVTYIVTTTPANTRDILVISWGHSKETWMMVFGQIGRLLLFMNYAINPFIYFVHSPQFRKNIRYCWRKQHLHNVSTGRTPRSMSSLSRVTEAVTLPPDNTHL